MEQAGALRKMKKMADKISEINLLKEQNGCDEDTRVIAITSGKGGVGKTNIAANFAYILSLMGKKVLLIDSDTGLPNIDVLLGIAPEYNLCHVCNGEKTLSEVMIQGPAGMKILPSASGVQQMVELSMGQKLTLLDALNDLSDRLDFVFIDTGGGIAGNVMYFNMVAKEIVVVLSSEPTSLTDACALIKVLYQGYSEKRFKILVNMVKSSNEARRVFREIRHETDHFLNLSVEYLGYVLCDNKVSEAVKKQHLFANIFPYSKATRCLVSIAKKLCQEGHAPYESGTMKIFSKSIVDNNGI